MRLLFVLIAALAAALLPGMSGNDQFALRSPAAPQSPSGKRIALSFDDVPRAAGAFYSEDERATRIIAALKTSGVGQAAFFINPGRVDPEDHGAEHIAAYAAAGHVIADHGFEHLELKRTSVPAYLADIDKAEAWLKGRPGYRPWFRYPFLDGGGTNLDKAAEVRAGLAARGLHNGYVTADGDDWNMERLTVAAKREGRPIDLAALRNFYVETHVQAADFADALARRALGRSPVHMLLLHETDVSAMFVTDLVAALRRDGWEIVTADQAYADPMHDVVPKSPTASGTLIEQFAWEKKLPPPRWYDRNDLKVANAMFETRVMHPPQTASSPDRSVAGGTAAAGK